LNASLEKYEAAAKSNNVSAMISLQQDIRFNGGGHINHTLFWENLAPKSAGGGDLPSGELENMINDRFGNFNNFKAAMNEAGLKVQGSGWAWLGYNKAANRLEVAATPNQDPLILNGGLIPLLGIDVWEHAYYLTYKNMRGEYLNAIWQVMDFKNVAKRLADAKK